MPQPDARTVHVDTLLSTISVATMQNSQEFIASRVFPRVTVSKQSDLYPTFDQNDWLRDEAQLRAPSSESAGGGYNVGTDNYFAKVYAFHKDVPDQVAANTDAAYGDPEATAAEFVTEKILLKMEKEWHSAYFTTGVWTGSSTGADITPAAPWDNYATSTPVRDIRAQARAIRMQGVKTPNTLVLSDAVYTALLDHPDFIDRIKNVSDAAVTRDIVRRFFEVDNLYVSSGIQATNVEGGTATIAPIANDYALLVYAPPAPSLMTPSGGYTFVWDGVSDGAGLEIGTVRIEIPEKRTVRIESQMAWDFKVVSPLAGALFTGVLTS